MKYSIAANPIRMKQHPLYFNFAISTGSEEDGKNSLIFFRKLILPFEIELAGCGTTTSEGFSSRCKDSDNSSNSNSTSSASQPNSLALRITISFCTLVNFPPSLMMEINCSISGCIIRGLYTCPFWSKASFLVFAAGVTDMHDGRTVCYVCALAFLHIFFSTQFGQCHLGMSLYKISKCGPLIFCQNVLGLRTGIFVGHQQQTISKRPGAERGRLLTCFRYRNRFAIGGHLFDPVVYLFIR